VYHEISRHAVMMPNAKNQIKSKSDFYYDMSYSVLVKIANVFGT
jgi:hypothetical protein